MNFLLRNLNDIAILGIWAVLWLVGGYWIARYAFRLRDKDQFIIGIALGIIVDTWVVNLLTFVLPADAAFFAGALITFALGIAFAFGVPIREWLKISIPWGQVIAFLALTYIFTMMSRGLAIYDDYAHLPTLSMMAAGDLPPHFPLDPQVSYGYHYFLMLFAAQWMRIGELYPWNALDLVRGISFALTILLVYIWAERMTFSKLGGLAGAMMATFGMGTRWVLLLLPPAVITWLEQGMELIGSGRLTGATLSEALSRSWGIEGAGPVAYPFAFVNGIYSPGVMHHGPNGSVNVVILLLLTFNRWRGWRGVLVTTIILAAGLLLSETGVLLLLAGFVLVALIEIIRQRSFHLPKQLWVWMGITGLAVLIGLLQGGALKDIASGVVDPDAISYQTVGFKIIWPPEIVSSHLGVLSIFKPGQLIVAMLEIGPVLLVLPLFLIFGWKAMRSSRWYEAALAGSGLLSLSMLLVEFSGSTGVRNTSRLYEFVGLCSIFFVPLVWMWAARRKDAIKAAAFSLASIMMVGGIVLTGVQIHAIQQPVYSYFLGDLDVQMERDYWNKLEPDALVFDPIVSRSATIFARGSNSNYTWYKSKPEWEKLLASPEPSSLATAGYRYAYFDQKSWDEIPLKVQQLYQNPCVQTINEIEDWRHDFRKLMDVSACTSVN